MDLADRIRANAAASPWVNGWDDTAPQVWYPATPADANEGE